MLWIEKYRPARCEDVLGQEQVVRRLISFAESHTVPHLMLVGPNGTGKSVALECLARRLYGENWEDNVSVVNAEDLFSQGKAYLEAEERFAHIYRKDESLVNNFKYIVKWYASMRPLDAEFKLVAFEGAHALTLEAQQALRRTLERYSDTCRFVFATTNASAIIPAISSRCLPLNFLPIENGTMTAHLRHILSKEAPNAALEEELSLIVQAARGDLRKAIVYLQLTVESDGKADLADISDSEAASITATAFSALREGDYHAARRIVEALMIEYGISGKEVLLELRRAAKREYNDPRIAIAIARTDSVLAHNTNEFVQIDALLAEISGEVFGEESTAAL
jgi:replication factor C small subunit